MKTLAFLLLSMALTATAVKADNISISLNLPNQTGNPGSTLKFFGTITNTDANTADAPTYLNLDGLNLALSDATAIDLFFANVPISLAPGESSGSIELFDFNLANPEGQPFGSYPGTYVLLGGIDGGANTAQNILAQVSFSVDVQPALSPVPEPGTFGLLGTVLVLATWHARGTKKRRTGRERRLCLSAIRRIAAAWAMFASVLTSNAQIDPGPRSGPSSAGDPVETLNADEVNLYWAARDRFKEISSVSGTIGRGVGLGPAFNGNSCAGCHAQPAAGGSSPGPSSSQVYQLEFREGRLALGSATNPQLMLATLDRFPGKKQTIPAFLTPNGPVRVVRFIAKPDGTPDGSVHNIFTIAGRVDAPGCTQRQPDFAAEIARKNVTFRIPTPIFGGGLIEAIPDAVLMGNLDADVKRKQELGVRGRFNRTANDGTISRFGWKGQNKSLLLFAAESYAVEQGVTNDLFPNERDSAPGCDFNALPEDTTRLQLPPGVTYQPSAFASDVVNLAAFMRLLAPPKPKQPDGFDAAGAELFRSTGCVLCHSPSLTTGKSPYTGMSNIEVHPYSDFALHQMGPGLTDHISQGLAKGDEFRTAPLWGVGQRIFFLHDGRTNDLLGAIESHASTDRNCRANPQTDPQKEACASEANGVIAAFNALSASQKQSILNFLRSL